MGGPAVRIPVAPALSLTDTGALCSEIYNPELFTKVRRPVYPLDRIADPRDVTE